MNSTVRLMRLPTTRDMSGFGTTSIYDQTKRGLFPPSVRLTKRSVAWVEHEVAAVINARIAGKNDDEIRQLVGQLVAARAQALPAVLRSSQVGQVAA